MVGWTGRWEPGAGRDHHQLPQPQQQQQRLAVTDHVAGLDPPILPLSTPTPSPYAPSHAHNHTHSHPGATHPQAESSSGEGKSQSPIVGINCDSLNSAAAEGGSEVGGKCVERGQDPIPSSSSLVPDDNSCSGGAPAASVETTTAASQHDHSFLSRAPTHQTPPPSAPAAVNGTSRPPCVAGGHSEHSRWGATEDTAPLTTNGEVGRRKVNGVVVKKMAAMEEAVTEEEEEEEEEVGEGEFVCGLGRWCSPSWVQRLATKQMFLIVFSLTSVLQGMFYTYFVSVLTTVEKLFQLKSKTTGIIMSATEMGQIGGALLLAYYGGQGHRPKWIGWGMILFAFCAFLSALPHFLFGPELLRKHLETTPSEESPLASANICKMPGTRGTSEALNATLSSIGVLDGPEEGLLDFKYCDSPDGKTHVVLAIFFLSLLGIGIGQTAAYNLGIPYIDDNIANRETPIYFAVTSGVRILGPTLGFVLGSFCTRLYVDPLADPGIDPTDRRWIGAWWLGLVVVSVALFLTSTAMFAFPRRLPMSPRPVRSSLQPPLRSPSLRDFLKAVWRLLKNKILIFRTASSVLHILPIAGLYTFLPKYLESQFRLPVHSAALVSGIGGILVMGVGIFASGVLIRRAKPTARTVAGWIALTALIYSIGMVILMFVGCPPEDFAGLVEDENGKRFTPVCNRTCGECDTSTFAPVCDRLGTTYFSSCHLGCSNATLFKDSNQLVFSNCDCLKEGETAVLKLCGMKCNNFVWYVIIFSVFVLIHSTSEVGGMLVTLRCVDPTDKAMALGLISVAIGLLSNVPCPIIYGAVVDSACIQWKETCRKAGACQLYDSDAFRMFFHGMTGAVMMLAFTVDVVVWYMAKSLSFNEDEENPEEATPMNPRYVTPSPSTTMAIDQTPTTSATQDITPMLSPGEGESSISQESQTCV
ncbi:solute carrier organic anion transporter family member 74D [Panulirus ornatus]|uniref:solute carrier organic anion transporter family member 74D n=1 Tax=Panulirus ornatus TaxID=150431 RepID=UPI003A838E55